MRKLFSLAVAGLVLLLITRLADISAALEPFVGSLAPGLSLPLIVVASVLVVGGIVAAVRYVNG